MSTVTGVAPESAQSRPTAQDCRDLLSRLLASGVFRRSERQCAFLSYVFDVALTEPGREIREAELGCKVFSRPDGYDTAQDNIVRVNASEVRRRLEQYFQTEGAAEPVSVEIPRGSYKPVFRTRTAPPPVDEAIPAPVVAQELPPVQTTPRARPWSVPVLCLAALCCFALGAGSARLASRAASSTTRNDPTVRQFWSRFFTADAPADVLMADSCLSLFEDLTKQSVSLNQYVNRDYLSGEPLNSTIGREQRETLMDRRYTSMADVLLLDRLMLVAPPESRQRLTVFFARDYSSESLLKSNVIVIGSRRANPWAEPFDRSLNFRFEFFEDTNLTSIHNEHPLPGEKASYDQLRVRSQNVESFSVVALLPNLRGSGSVLLLEGSNMDATEAAGEFVTSERLLKELRRRLAGPESKTSESKAPESTAFPYFEALLESRRLGGGAVSDISILAVRKH